MIDWIIIAVLILQLVILNKQRKYHRDGKQWHEDLGNFYKDQIDDERSHKRK